MRNLVVCCDGTWNNPGMTEGGLPSPTNVVRLYNLCIRDSDQLCYYHPGVGTEGNFLTRALGGSLGTGLDANIQSGYEWLCRNYRPDDRIFLFGFSRGAYTVRCLCGFVLRCGLLDLTDLDVPERWSRVKTAYLACYRDGKPVADWTRGWSMHKDSAGRDPDIHFIGAWDTVGSRGIPDDLVWADLLFDDKRRYSFHDTRLSDRMHHVYHAVALDEPRSSFAPTLWTLDPNKPRPAGTTFSQLWFPGCHTDVGGGYGTCGLSDGTLKWMTDNAAAQGLRLSPAMLAQLRPDPQCPLHDSVKGFWKIMRTLPRATPELTEAAVGKTLHKSAWDRHQVPPIVQAPYRPSRRLAVGESMTVNVYARDRWNDTALWLDQDEGYRFEASGQWIDQHRQSGPGGIGKIKFRPRDFRYWIGERMGLLEGIYQWVMTKPGADWSFTKRVEWAPWFSLVGMVANQADADGGGTPSLGQILVIGEAFPEAAGPEFSPERSGYLYCFANDAWRSYGKNKGSVSLTVRRVR